MLPLLAFTPLREAAEAGDPRPAWIALAALAVASAGNIRTTSLRAFTEAEFQGIVDDLP